jgi:hypothetical protein
VTELELGVSAGIGALAWGLMFWFATGVGELFVVLHLRGILVRAKRPALGTTLVAVFVGCVVLPIGGAYAGCAFGAQRGAAEVYDQVDPGRAVMWAIERGTEHVREELALAEDTPITELEQLRAVATAKQQGDDRGVEEVLERALWWAIEVALDKAETKQLTWSQLVARAETHLKQKVREQLPDYGSTLRHSAWITLGVFLAVLILLNGAAIFLTRRQAAGEPSTPQA